MHQRDHLADVEARAAAEGDDAVMPPGLVGLDPASMLASIGLGRTSEKTSMPRPAFFTSATISRDHRHGRKPLVGDKQGALNAIGLAVLGQFRDAARAELDGGRVVKLRLGTHVLGFLR